MAGWGVSHLQIVCIHDRTGYTLFCFGIRRIHTFEAWDAHMVQNGNSKKAPECGFKDVCCITPE